MKNRSKIVIQEELTHLIECHILALIALVNLTAESIQCGLRLIQLLNEFSLS